MYCGLHSTVFLDTEGGMERVGGVEHGALSGCGGAGGWIRTVSHIKLLAGQRSSEEACVTE